MQDYNFTTMPGGCAPVPPGFVYLGSPDDMKRLGIKKSSSYANRATAWFPELTRAQVHRDILWLYTMPGPYFHANAGQAWIERGGLHVDEAIYCIREESPVFQRMLQDYSHLLDYCQTPTSTATAHEF